MQNLLHVELKICSSYGGAVNKSCLASAALILVHVLVFGGEREPVLEISIMWKRGHIDKNLTVNHQ